MTVQRNSITRILRRYSRPARRAWNHPEESGPVLNRVCLEVVGVRSRLVDLDHATAPAQRAMAKAGYGDNFVRIHGRGHLALQVPQPVPQFGIRRVCLQRVRRQSPAQIPGCRFAVEFPAIRTTLKPGWNGRAHGYSPMRCQKICIESWCGSVETRWLPGSAASPRGKPPCPGAGWWSASSVSMRSHITMTVAAVASSPLTQSSDASSPGKAPGSCLRKNPWHNPTRLTADGRHAQRQGQRNSNTQMLRHHSWAPCIP